MPGEEHFDAFLSYSHEDKEWVLELAEALEDRAKLHVWLDAWSLVPGQSWQQGMARGLEHADCCVVCISDNTPQGWCKQEIEKALNRQASQPSFRVIPVLLPSAKDQNVKDFLELRTWVDFRGEKSFEQAFHRLVCGIKGIPPGRGPGGNDDPPVRVWNVPMRRNLVFTGREEKFAEIDKAVGAGWAVALVGMSGTGKTQVAAEFAYRHREEYDAVLWTVADTEANLLSGFSGLARVLGLKEAEAKEPEVAVAAVRRWLEGNGKWLLVFDNVEDLDTLWAYLPADHRGDVVVTTQTQATGRHFKRVELEEMTPDAGALLLLRQAGMVDAKAEMGAAKPAERKLAEEISVELGGWPLALAQAGAYIEETGCGLAGYSKAYKKERARLLKRKGVGSEHESAFVSIQMCFEKLRAKNAEAAELLRLCAFLHPDDIPLEVIARGKEVLGPEMAELASNPATLDEAIAAARRFSLLERDAEAQTLRVHRQVQAVMRELMGEGTQRAWAERGVRAVNGVFPYIEFSNWPVCERLLPHALVCASHVHDWDFAFPEAGRMLNQAAFYLTERARYAEAEPLYRRALAIWEKALGPEHPDVAASVNNLAQLCWRQGRYEEAEPLFRRALEIDEKALGPEHPDVGTSLNNLAGLCHAQGRYEEAEPLHRRALVIWEKALGPEHPRVATSLNNLAELCREQGRYEEAEPLYRRALGIREKALGPEHPNVAQSLNNLALLYYGQKRYAEAEPLYRRSVEIKEKSLGPEHPDVATSLNNLAELYRVQGRHGEAEPLSRRALGIREKVLGPEHPNVGTCLGNLAGLLRETGREVEAAELEARAKAIGEKKR